MKNTLFVILFCLSASSVVGQSVKDYERRLYETYVSGKMKDWEPIIAEMSTSFQRNHNRELLYSLVFAQYGYIGYCISADREDEAKSTLQDAMKNAKELGRLYYDRHDVLALQGAFYGFKIILSKFQAMFLAPRAFRLVNEASQSSNRYFNCSLEIGNIRYFTPKFLGGSKEEAIAYYQNAVDLVEKSSHKEDRHWIYINTLLFLANTYFETGAPDKACKLYTRILDYEPRISWIREQYNERCLTNFR